MDPIELEKRLKRVKRLSDSQLGALLNREIACRFDVWSKEAMLLAEAVKRLGFSRRMPPDCLALAEQFLNVVFVTPAIAKARRAARGK